MVLVDLELNCDGKFGDDAQVAGSRLARVRGVALQREIDSAPSPE
jgi:hypothetical protein